MPDDSTTQSKIWRVRTPFGYFKVAVQRGLRGLGFEIVKWPAWPEDFGLAEREVIDRVRPYTMTPPERTYALIKAIEYIVTASVPGSIVECGVWRGGSMMAAALTLKRLGDERKLYLFDTFEGMTEPTPVDVNPIGVPAKALLQKQRRAVDLVNDWAFAPLDTVRNAMMSTGYEAAAVHLIKGRVEDTIPDAAPEQIALLRLDTDWYSSTKHELEHLYPRVSSGGVVIIDDYGHWAGARQATDEYLAKNRIPLLLCRIDYAARIGTKVAGPFVERKAGR